MIDKLAKLQVGPLPLPVYLLLAAVLYGASMAGRLPEDMIGGFAAIMVLGWLFGDIGLRTPLLKDIGGPAIVSMFIPSILIFYHLLNADLLKAITAVMRTSNFLYLYISCLVCGSILGMRRQVLIQGFLRMAVPLAAGTLAATAAGLAMGALLGYGVKQTFFFIVMPIMGGGIGEGILPYSLVLSDVLSLPQAGIIARLAPAAMLGNVAAIVACGLLKKLAAARPDLDGQGLLVRGGDDQNLVAEMNAEKPADFALMGGGLLLACGFFIFGSLVSPLIGVPGAIIMIFTAATVKIAKLMPERMELGAYQMYRFIAGSLTWPLLVGLGVLYLPWQDVVAAVTPAYVAICAATVLAMVASGFFVGKALGMYPIEAAIVTACHSGLGGTGDVAILSAANRMGLMPFAQVSTRLGGAIMIVLATFLLKVIGP